MNEMTEKDDISKLDVLLKNLVQNGKITKKQLIQKLMQVSETD